MRLRQETAPKLPEVVIVMALRGWSAIKELGPLSPADSTAAFEAFRGNEQFMARLWRAHEPFLRAEAERRGIQPLEDEDGPPLFFAERCAADVWLRREAPR